MWIRSSLFAFLILVTPASFAAHVPQIPTAYLELFGPAGGGALMYMESMYLPPVTTGPWAPAWAPDGRTIAFAMQGSLWSVPAEGGEATQLTASAHYDSEPDWSPDGRRIVFTRDTGDHIDLWIVSADDTAPRKLTESKFFAVDPKWSPDGQRILFVTMTEDLTLGLWSIAPDGGNPEPVLSDSFQNISPSWSPDGEQIVFVSNRRWGEKRIQGTGGIWTFRLGAASPEILLPEETVYHARPAWSPDGKKVAYASLRSSKNELWVISAQHGNPYRLTFDDGEVFTPAWSPDSREIAYISNAGGLFTLYRVPAAGGTPERVELTSRKHRYPVGEVEVVVTDEASGEPTDARVYLTASDGRGYVPKDGFHRMVVVTGDHYFQSSGRFTVALPEGPATIEAIKGFEYHPVRRDVDVVAGKTTTVTLPLERFIDLPARGWYSGDNHIHMNYGGIFQATPRSLMQEAKSEDLHVINDLIANQSGTRIHDLQYFEGKLHELSEANRLLYFNEEYRPSFAGHLSLLNLKKLIFPQFGGFAGTSLAAHYPTNSSILDRVHAQGGVAGYVHPFLIPGTDPEDRDYRGAREFPVNVALGNVDYYDVMCIWSDEYVTAKVWYRLLNLGFRVPASAGTDAMTNYWRAPAIGSTRVYVKSGSPLDYGNWIRGLTQGRTFVTNGPLLFLRVDGKEPGDGLRVSGDSVRVEAEASSIFPMETLDILLNGEVVHTEKPADPHSVALETTLPVGASGWIAARVTGPERQPLLMDSYVYAHTSPVYLMKDGAPVRSPEDARYFVRWIDHVLGLVEQLDSFETEAQRREVQELWRRARRVYVELAEQ